MLYEAVIQFTGIDKKGNDKTYRERYIVDECDFFASAETKMYEEFSKRYCTDLDVTDIKRSKVKEIINEKPKDGVDYKIFFATIVDKFYNADTDETKEMKYTVALFALDIKDAYKNIEQYMKQGFEDMELKEIKETKILDIL